MMKILFISGLIIASPFIAVPLSAQNGPCSATSGPSIHLRIIGLKHRTGKVRVRLFGGDPKTYFDKRYPLERIEFAAPRSGDIERCIVVPSKGTYAIDVRHDANNNGKSDRSDGAGASGNPDVSLLDIIFKKKPPLSQVQITVGRGTTDTTIIVKYLSGGRMRPA